MKFSEIVCLMMGGITLSACQQANSTSKLCADTIRDYARLRDNPKTADAYADLFTEDGIFTLAGQITEGREALAARHRIANETAVWRHNMIDIDVREQDGKILGDTRFIVQTGPRGSAPGPVTREIIGSYADVFEFANGRCLIKSRVVSVDFDTRADLRKD